MAEFRISVKEVTQKADELRNLNGQLKSAVAELEALEGELTGMWEGAAKEAFHSAFTSDKGQMDTFTNVIETFIQTLEGVVGKYAAAEMINMETAASRTYK